MRWVAFVVVIAGCGRVGFEPVASGDGGAPHGDGSPSGDGLVADGSAIDGAAATPCASAIDVAMGVSAAQNNCTGTDLIDGCGPAGTKELIYRFVVPATSGYNFDARDISSGNITSSIGALNAGCTATTTCAGIFGTSLTAGQVFYFMVEAGGGGCDQYKIEIN